MFGCNELVTIFNSEDIEKVFRSEGKLPHRYGLETLQFYRKNIRPEIYGEYGSLASEYESFGLNEALLLRSKISAGKTKAGTRCGR